MVVWGCRVRTSKKYRLGLDLGTNSLGWCVIALDGEDRPSRFLRMGVRIFPDGRNHKGSSLAADRRLARSMRRRRDRFLKRRARLMRLMIEHGFMPPDRKEREALRALGPYELRRRGLDAPLTPFEFGRVLFHLNQRRGFRSNRKIGWADGASFGFWLNRKKLREVRRREGRYLLRTNLTDSDPAKLWEYYIQLVAVEEAFKTLKGDLSIRPIFDQFERRIEAHIFIAFLAYCLHVTLGHRLKHLAPGLTTRSALEKFSAVQMIGVRIPTAAQVAATVPV